MGNKNNLKSLQELAEYLILIFLKSIRQLMISYES